MALSTTNILIYSAQIFVLISAAAIGTVTFRLPLSRARLAYCWRLRKDRESTRYLPC